MQIGSSTSRQFTCTLGNKPVYKMGQRGRLEKTRAKECLRTPASFDTPEQLNHHLLEVHLTCHIHGEKKPANQIENFLNRHKECSSKTEIDSSEEGDEPELSLEEKFKNLRKRGGIKIRKNQTGKYECLMDQNCATPQSFDSIFGVINHTLEQHNKCLVCGDNSIDEKNHHFHLDCPEGFHQFLIRNKTIDDSPKFFTIDALNQKMFRCRLSEYCPNQGELFSSQEKVIEHEIMTHGVCGSCGDKEIEADYEVRRNHVDQHSN